MCGIVAVLLYRRPRPNDWPPSWNRLRTPSSARRYILMLVPPHRQDELQTILATIQSGEHVHRFETVRVRKGGREIPISLTVSPIRDSAGQITGASTIARDITEVKQAESQREAALQALHDKVEALQTLAQIDHEIIATTELQEVLDFVCRRAAALLRAPKATMTLETAPGELCLVASVGLLDPGATAEGLAQLQRERPLPDWHQRIVIDEHSQFSSNVPTFQEWRLREGIHALASVPLALEERTLGTLAVLDMVRREWTCDELDLLGLLAGQAALAIDKARLYEETRAHARQLELLYDAGLALNQVLDVRQQL